MFQKCHYDALRTETLNTVSLMEVVCVMCINVNGGQNIHLQTGSITADLDGFMITKGTHISISVGRQLCGALSDSGLIVAVVYGH